ncbi:MAG: protoheme IX farnesyltransferase [Burkholderiales bacterium]|nr:protoheme IX farnesyltransferase [Burkholderiales bacterium]
MSTIADTAPLRGIPVLRDVVALLKLRIGFMIMVTALVGLAVAPGPAAGGWQLLLLALSVLGASASAGAFNHYYERKSDRLMARTRGRPFVTGALPDSRWWLLPIGLLLALSVAAAAWGLNPLSAACVFLGAFFYGVVYTVWLKRRSPWNIVVGGLAGSFAVLAGATAVEPVITAQPLLLALVLFLWTPPHFWSLAIANRAEYAAAGVPMLPVVVGPARAARIVLWSTIALALAALLPGWFGAGSLYMAGALAGGGYFTWRAWLLCLDPSPETAMRAFFASLVQLSLLLAAATVDSLLH